MPASRIFPRLVILLVLLAGGFWLARWWSAYTRTQPGLAPSGGIYFPIETVIDVPQFFQADPRWAADTLGATGATLAAEGCALASAAMVLASYGADLDPGRLNAFVNGINGYTDRGWLYWEAASEYAAGLARHAYEADASHRLIDGNLLAGNPVIIRIHAPGRLTHFVVIVGKRGFDYLIRDPGGGGTRGVYPLKELGLPIEALRFYQPLRPAGSPPLDGPADPLAAALQAPPPRIVGAQN